MKILWGVLLFTSTLGYSQSQSSYPSQYLVAIAKKLESLGYRADTIRARKVGYTELKNAKVTIRQNLIFYKLNSLNSQIINATSFDNYLKDQNSLDLFKNVTIVWSYFYRNDLIDKGNYIDDGIIEQWEFNSKEKAILAMNKLNSVYPMPFFNTQPCYFQSGNILYVFHTRADMFSYKQKEFFNLFKELLKKD